VKPSSLQPVPTLSIAAVERDTGLSKDTLRVWERRYGFPAPGRDPVGERAYTLQEVEKLRVIKRLLDAGHRPGRIVPLAFEELQQFSRSGSGAESIQSAEHASDGHIDLAAHIALIRAHDMRGLRGALTRLLVRLGVARFVIDVLCPLNTAVGDAWMRGQMEIFEEHMTTEVVQMVLRQAIAGIPDAPADSRPRVLLSTFPGEPHGLGLLMAQAMLALEGCDCVPLGVQTPLWDTVLAAGALRSDIVALSFTGCMNPNQVVDGLSELRRKLPSGVRIWVGGAAPVLVRRPVPGVDAMVSLHLLPDALRNWHAARATQDLRLT
jgi:methanogenic corrinoid protein MtbC1